MTADGQDEKYIIALKELHEISRTLFCMLLDNQKTPQHTRDLESVVGVIARIVAGEVTNTDLIKSELETVTRILETHQDSFTYSDSDQESLN